VKKEKEQDGIGKMEQEIGEMVPSRLQPKELHIHHVGNPGQGMPVCGMSGGECPLDALYGEAVLNVPVFCNVPGIIETDEIAVRDLPEGYEGGDSEEGDDEQMLFR
jgi:hypothetical protein